ncbi:MAG: winged helix DNA-binding protein [Pseudomonadales bacterium]|nr:winged helix DNA-binding protein [Halioglobus sp.]MCP5131796.1 winged helix DNA-binding protein [Pseudomonadales bacterium]
MNSQDNDELQHAANRRLSTTLARVLRELSRDFDRRVTRRLHELGHADISLSHQVVFSNIGLGRTRVTELAERAQITQQAMGKTLRELESLGYIERVVDETDRRAKDIRLTARGRQLVTDAVASIDEVKREYAAKIGQAELADLDGRLRDAAIRLELDFLPHNWAEATES